MVFSERSLVYAERMEPRIVAEAGVLLKALYQEALKTQDEPEWGVRGDVRT